MAPSYQVVSRRFVFYGGSSSSSRLESRSPEGLHLIWGRRRVRSPPGPMRTSERIHKVDLKYGDGKITIRVPERASAVILQPQPAPVLPSVEAALDLSLNSPVGCEPLDELLAPAAPALGCDRRARRDPPGPAARGAAPSPAAPAARVARAAGPARDHFHRRRAAPARRPGGDRAHSARGNRGRIPVVAHDARTAPMRDYGTTRRGTPVSIHAGFAQAELKVVIGQVDPHQL